MIILTVPDDKDKKIIPISGWLVSGIVVVPLSAKRNKSIAMFKVNQYFEGKVMSMAYTTEKGNATLGIMAAGEYEFGTSTVEHMTVISGTMKVLLPGETEWKAYSEFETFVVPANAKFRVRMNSETAYRCLYE